VYKKLRTKNKTKHVLPVERVCHGFMIIKAQCIMFN